LGILLYKQTRSFFSKYQGENISDEDQRIINEKIVSVYVATERNKEASTETIAEEYTEKVILLGYVMVNILVLFFFLFY
jgi:hypothetical protein